MTSKYTGTTYRPGNVGSEWLRSAVRAVRNRWIVLVVGAVVGGCLGAFLTTTQSPSYESSAVIYQTPHFGDTDGMSRQRSEAYTKLLTSDRLIETALGNSGVNLSISDVRDMTTASANVGSAILTVTVRADDPETSAELANVLAQALPGTVAALDGITPGVDQSGNDIVDPVRLSVISPALADDAEGGPKYGRNTILGVVAGLLVGLLYAYLRTQVSRKVQDGAALGKFLSGPVTAIVPADKALQSGLVDFLGDGPATEAFRRLRTVIADHEPGQDVCLTLVVSSAVGGDGKTAIAVNLAIALAESGHDVIYVDATPAADPRRQPRHRTPETMPASTSPGLSGYLRGEGEGDIGRYLVRSRHRRLSVLPGGHAVAGQSELLATSRMRTGLAELAARSDFVIVDSTPLSARSDALVLGRYADGVLMVARSDHTRYTDLGSAIEQLSSAGVPVLGVVLNDHPRPLVRGVRTRRRRLSGTRLLSPAAPGAADDLVTEDDPAVPASPAGNVDRR